MGGLLPEGRPAGIPTGDRDEAAVRRRIGRDLDEQPENLAIGLATSVLRRQDRAHPVCGVLGQLRIDLPRQPDRRGEVPGMYGHLSDLHLLELSGRLAGTKPGRVSSISPRPDELIRASSEL